MSSTTTHSPADVIRYLLVAAGHGTLPSTGGAWPASMGNEPSSPDNCVTLYNTTGTTDGRSMVGGELFIHEGFQVRVRATTEAVGWAKAKAILEYLAETVKNTPITIGSSSYVVYACTRFTPILSLGRESGTSRRLFTIDAVVSMRQSA